MESRHTHSIKIQEEEGGSIQDDVVVVENFGNHQQNQQNKSYTKIQDVAEEEKTREIKGVQEEEVVGNKGTVAFFMLVGFVTNMVTLEMTTIKYSTKGDMVKEISKGTMYLL